MKMTLPQLARVARNHLQVVREHNLDSFEALEGAAGEPLDPAADDRCAGEEYVIVRRHGPARLSLDNFRRIGQTPLMFIVSTESVKAMLTAEEVLDGYDPFERTDDDDPGWRGHVRKRSFLTPIAGGLLRGLTGLEREGGPVG